MPEVSHAIEYKTNWIFVGIGALTIVVTSAAFFYSCYQRLILKLSTPGPVALWVFGLLPWASVFRVADLCFVTTQLTVNPKQQPFYEIVLGIFFLNIIIIY